MLTGSLMSQKIKLNRSWFLRKLIHGSHLSWKWMTIPKSLTFCPIARMRSRLSANFRPCLSCFKSKWQQKLGSSKKTSIKRKTIKKSNLHRHRATNCKHLPAIPMTVTKCLVSTTTRIINYWRAHYSRRKTRTWIFGILKAVACSSQRIRPDLG